MFFAIRLAKSGYYGGNVERILAAPISRFVAILEYEAFEADYEREYISLNTPEK